VTELLETLVIDRLSGDFPEGIGLLQALKSRLVGGVIFDILPCFIGFYQILYSCPHICPPMHALRSPTFSGDGLF
jgi:hypothetical protein